MANFMEENRDKKGGSGKNGKDTMESNACENDVKKEGIAEFKNKNLQNNVKGIFQKIMEGKN